MKLLNKSRTGRTLNYFLKFFFKRKLAISVNLTFTPIAVFFGEILVGYYVGILFQKIVEFDAGDNAAPLYSLVWTIIIFFIIQIIFYRINDYTAVWRQTANLRDLEQYIFSKLPLHSYRFFSENYGGALVSQVNRFLKSYEQFDFVVIFDYLEMFSRIIFSTIILLFIAPPLGILLGSFAVIFVFAVAYTSMKKAPITREDSAADSKVIAFLSDAITNIVNVKTFARSGKEIKDFKKVSDDRYRKRFRSYRFNAHIRDFRWVIALTFFIVYLFLSISLVTNGSITPATMVAGQIYVFAILNSLLRLHQIIQMTEQLFADAAELTDVLDLEPELKDPTNPEQPRIENGMIEFNSVKFKYPNTKRYVFDGLDLKLTPGQKVGLVGHSGSGKSTITRLLLRFLDIQEGEILIDGQNITNVTQDDLRRHMAYIPQEPILFHRSLMDNIAYGREDATKEEVYGASKHAYADDFIQELPDKYDTLVGERGVKLSGGEKQRVAIARAMLSQAPILILDEATSALDSKSEKYITEALDELMKGRTTIVIAHRLSTIQKLDRVIVLKDGNIIEDGAHDELLKLNGEYAELWSHQSGGFLDPE